MKKFYDLALVDKCTGNMIATWAGLECSMQEALLNLMRRSEGKIPPAAHRLITLSIETLTGIASESRFGYIVRSMSEVKNF
jgi:hypothetical protein